MTENEKIIEEANEIAKGRMYATNEVIRLQKELEQYRAIGTVEEFKDLKNTDIPIIHGKAELDLHDKEIRNKAIDDFAKEIEAEYDNDDCPNVADYLDYEISIRKLFEIAEQLKGEKQ